MFMLESHISSRHFFIKLLFEMGSGFYSITFMHVSIFFRFVIRIQIHKSYLLTKRQFIYAIVLFSFPIFFCFEGKTEPIRYSELTDSLRLKIRLTSHLLIPANKIENYRNIVGSGIPYAIDCREYKADLSPELFSHSDQDKKVLVLTKNDSLISGSGFIQVTTNDFEEYQDQKFAKLNSDLPNFSAKELLLVELLDGLKTSEMLVELWRQGGKMPNFISIEKIDSITLDLIKELNSYRTIFGVLESEVGLLSDVILRADTIRKISGYFSFPLLGKVSLKPYKAGYQFSPDVIHNAPNNEKNMKVFRAIRLENSFGLSDHFRFSRKVKNLVRPVDEGFVVQNVRFIKDEQLGPVAFFDNAFVDAGLESRKILNSTFSISVWIKPTKLGNNNSILGKGTNFVLKIHEGNLTFTMAGIKDYISMRSGIPVNTWTHVAVVYSEIERNLKFYLNGQKTDQISLIADYAGSDHSLLIGSNLWEEFFVGYMGDVKIWERELNEQEIQDELQSSTGEKRNWMGGGFVLILLLFTLSGYFAVRKKRKAKPDQVIVSEEPQKEAVSTTIHAGSERISCFGNLKIICENGTDLSLKLSPKLKQLFILILIHSGPGQKGIGSKKMNGFLWPGMNDANAKNTRGTSIQNLRQALSTCKGINISFKDKMWILEIDEDVSCDLFEAENILSQFEASNNFQPEISKINQLTRLLKDGKLLQPIESSWLDEIKGQFSNRLVEFCLAGLEKPGNSHPQVQLDLAVIISQYDELNETALKIKLNILTAQGKHGLAKSVYENFTKLYAELYDCNYPLEFTEIVTT